MLKKLLTKAEYGVRIIIAIKDGNAATMSLYMITALLKMSRSHLN